MYNPLLDTFIVVADYGSFSKAASHLYISSTAVMKQINALEKELHLQLLNRTRQGISLTPAGKIIYKEAKFMIDYSQKVIAQAQSMTMQYEKTFCVGTSLLNPAKPFMDLWYQVNRDFPDYKLHLVPFDDDHESILLVIQDLGTRFDFLIGVCDSQVWLSYCSFLPLGYYRKMIAVSREHPFASKTQLTISDLFGQTLMMIPRGSSKTNDAIRDELEKYPEIKIEDTTENYDMHVFNEAVESNKLLLMNECWKEVHPGLITIPVKWDYRIPYGLLYALNPPKDVIAFVEAIRQIKKTNEKE